MRTYMICADVTDFVDTLRTGAQRKGGLVSKQVQDSSKQKQA